MELDYRVENFICILTLHDHFAADHGESIIKLVKTSLEAKILGMIVDFSEINKVGDEEIDWIVYIFYALKKQQIKMAFCNLNQPVLVAMQKKYLDTMVTIYQTEREAIEAFE